MAKYLGCQIKFQDAYKMADGDSTDFTEPFCVC